jgi:hypothetical protein
MGHFHLIMNIRSVDVVISKSGPLHAPRCQEIGEDLTRFITAKELEYGDPSQQRYFSWA